MLQLLVCSDVHTYINNIPLAIRRMERTDAVLIAGDIEAERDALESVLDNVPYFAICGNCDYYLNTDYPEELLIDITDSPASGSAPAIEKVTQLKYDTLPDRFHSLPPFLQKNAPAFLRGKLGGEKRNSRITHRILMTHGKEYQVPETLHLSRRAELWDADLVIFGHTHKYMDAKERSGKIRFLNPGCLVGNPEDSIRTWGNIEICSYAVLRIGINGEISIQHLYLE